MDQFLDWATSHHLHLLGALFAPILLQLWRERKAKKAEERAKAFKAMGLDHLI